MNVNYIWNMKVHIFEDDETTVGKRALRPGLKWVVLNGTTAPDGRWQRFGGKASTICPPLPHLLLLLLLLHLPTQVHHLLPTWSNKNLSCNRRQKPLKLLLIVLFFNVASMFCVRLHSFSWTDALPQEADAPRGGDMDKGGHMAKQKISLFLGKMDVLKSSPPVSWSREYLTWIAGLNYENTCLQLAQVIWWKVSGR